MREIARVLQKKIEMEKKRGKLMRMTSSARQLNSGTVNGPGQVRPNVLCLV